MFYVLILSLLLSGIGIQETVHAQTTQYTPPAPAKSYVLMDYQSGNLLVNFNGDERRAPASLTKLMSAYVIFSALKSDQINLEDTVIISDKAWRQGGSKMFVEINAAVKVDDLLMGMVVQSGNDATIALAEHVSGNEANFVHSMNQAAQRLGLKNSYFANACGFDANNYMSAYDIALLSRAIIQEFPDEYSRYSIRDFKYNNIQQINRNGLLKRDPTVDGLKTGHTSTAGYGIAASAKRNQDRLISVVLGADTPTDRLEVSQSLLNYGFGLLKSGYGDDNAAHRKNNTISPEKTCTEYECDNTGRCIEVTISCDE